MNVDPKASADGPNRPRRLTFENADEWLAGQHDEQCRRWKARQAAGIGVRAWRGEC